MNTEDRAVVVGVRLYPGFSDLAGPENDARAFQRWLVDPSGGAVPPENVELIVSSNYYPDAAHPPTSITDALPTMVDITRALDRLCDLSEARSRAGKGCRVGRRLYLYFAGHGFCPGHENAAPGVAHTALLAANAAPGRTNHHVSSTSYAIWFRMAGRFDEVLLFMDCCREDSMRARLNPAYDDKIHPNAARAFHFNAFATRWRGLAREKPMADGVVHGVFTSALLAGLNGAASTPQGEITAESLDLYLRENMQSFLSEEELRDPLIPKEPEIDFNRNRTTRFVIARVPPPPVPATPRFSVRIHLEPLDLGKTICIHNGAFELVESAKIDASPWCVALPRGLYVCELVGEAREVNFSVRGAGSIDVDF